MVELDVINVNFTFYLIYFDWKKGSLFGFILHRSSWQFLIYCQNVCIRH